MTVDIHGKTYTTVAERVVAFRAEHPITEGWCLRAECVERGEHLVTFRAGIYDPTGREVAVGWAEEDRRRGKINQTAAVENCETSALGRALAAAGYGGDVAYASANEVVSAQAGKDTSSAAERRESAADRTFRAQGEAAREVLRALGANSPAAAHRLIQEATEGALGLGDLDEQPARVLAVMREYRDLQHNRDQEERA